MKELKNISIKQWFLSDEQFEEEVLWKDDERRASSAFVDVVDDKLVLLVPYDGGVCYQSVDLEKLLDMLKPYISPYWTMIEVIDELKMEIAAASDCQKLCLDSTD